MTTLEAIKPEHVAAESVVDIDMYDVPGHENDFHEAWKRLQRPEGPAFLWTPRNGGHWIATRGKDIMEIWSDGKRFSSAGVIIPKAESQHYKLIPLQLDGAEHAEFKRATLRGTTPKFVVAMQEPARRMLGELIDKIIDKGQCEFLEDIAEPWSIQLFLIFAGLPPEDWKRLRPLGSQIVRKDEGMSQEEMMELVNEYLGPVVRTRLDAPGEDAFSRMFAEPIFGKKMKYEDAMSMASDVLFAGLDTVASHLGFIAYHFAKYPEHGQALISKPNLVPTAIDELMRRYSTITGGREVVDDVELSGTLLKKGDIICVPFPLYNLDSEVFADPMEVDFERRPNHLGFGAGPHRCPGSAIARMELMTFVREWLARIPAFELDPAYPVKMKTGVVGALDKLHLRWTAA